MPPEIPESAGRALQPLRLWPGVAAAVVLVFTRLGLPIVWPEQTLASVLGGIAGGILIIAWWTFFSRAPRSERWGGLALIVMALAATWALVDVSISTGAMGGLLPMLAIPPLGVALVLWAFASRGLATGRRRATLAATIVIACGVWTLAKTGGFSSNFDNDLMWRWAPSPEDRLLVDPSVALPATETSAALPSGRAATPAAIEPADTLTAEAPRPDTSAVGPVSTDALRVAASGALEEGADPAESARVEWPGFRGALRDGIVRGTRIETDWTAHPPVALWRRPIGPGWSSFAVHGDHLYTQEQRGDDEIVASYSVTTGKPVWSHRDATRFWESNGGAGPRATPTLSGGRVYTFGATGILNALDPRNGAVVWSHNVAGDTHTQTPMWGFASSPVVTDGLVIVAASGTLAAYDAATGEARWVGPRPSPSSGSYSSPQRMTIDGVEQIVLLNEAGAAGIAAADGNVLWEHRMPGGPILQPAVVKDGDLVIHGLAMDGVAGIRRLAVSQRPGGWTVDERWTSSALKSMSSDFVINKGHAFGFDGNILACIDLEGGTRKWKGGRYGSGQLILLADQDVLLVVTEEGELALVSATPDKFTELARLPALEGKTWNHPVLVGDILLVRNGEEMAAFRLALQRR